MSLTFREVGATGNVSTHDEFEILAGRPDMTDHDDHNTEAATTEQGGPPATELAATEDLDSSEEWSPRDSTAAKKWWARAGLLAVVTFLVAMTVINPAATFFRSVSSKHAAPAAKPNTTAAVNPPPSPAAVAPSAAPAATPTPGLSAYDEKFLSLMSQEGWGCSENSGAEQCKTQMVSFAHQICSFSGQSVDTVYQNFDLPALLGPGEKRMAIVNAEQSYPNCTFTRNP
jgi:hypothetical protein